MFQVKMFTYCLQVRAHYLCLRIDCLCIAYISKHSITVPDTLFMFCLHFKTHCFFCLHFKTHCLWFLLYISRNILNFFYTFQDTLFMYCLHFKTQCSCFFAHFKAHCLWLCFIYISRHVVYGFFKYISRHIIYVLFIFQDTLFMLQNALLKMYLSVTVLIFLFLLPSGIQYRFPN